jgi:rhodanese-related sulfurtransferase
MLKKLLVPFLILALLMVVGCDKDDPTEPDPVDEFKLVTDVGDVYFTSYTTTSGAGVNVAISAIFDNLTDGNAANDPFIIDYRSAADYADGHIVNANNIALGDLVAKMEDGTVPTDKMILNVCYTGQTASAATALLNLSGYEAQNLLFGMCAVDTSINGTDKWLNQIAVDEHAGDLVATVSTTTTTYDFPTLATGEEEASEIMKDTFAASGWTIAANDVWDNPSNFFIINYWPEAEYISPGHIPGAYQFTPNSSLKYDESLNLLPTDKTIVVYCYTAQTSAQVATYLRILGYDAKSLLYGVGGFAWTALAGHKYTAAPAPGIYDAILVK